MEGMKAKPDGYTLILISAQSWVGYYYSKTYDAKVWEKLTPVGTPLSRMVLLKSWADSPFKTWAVLAKRLRKIPEN